MNRLIIFMKLKDMGLIRSGLIAVLSVVLAGAFVHAASDQLKSARMTDSTLASQIDDKVGELETALGIILGITLDGNVSALFSVTSTGLITVQYDLTLPDSTALTLGTGGDVDIEYDGTDLLINPAVVGSGDVVISGGSLELSDSESLTLGTGKDATVLYDGTDVVVNPRAVGTGGVKLDAGTLFIKEQADADTDKAAYGQIWVNTATPNTLFFTDDAGTDTQLGAAGGTDMTAHAVTVGGGAAGTDIVWTFDGETGDGTFTYDEDNDTFNILNANLVTGTQGAADGAAGAAIHVKRADSGGTANGGALLTLEHSAESILAFLSATNNQAAIHFGDSDDNDAGSIVYNHSNGNMTIASQTDVNIVVDSALVMQANRTTNDGIIAGWAQDGSREGDISVSGTTVAYNTFMGAHYAQFLGAVPQIEFGHVVVSAGKTIPLKALPQNRGPFDLEKLMKVKKSSVRGERAVYGVYRHLEKDKEMAGFSSDFTGKKVASIAALGLFFIRVTDTAGNIANGDYLQTSTRAGEAEKQVDGSSVYESTLQDKTVAKALVDVNWNVVQVDPALGYKWKLIPATLHAG